MDIKTEVKKLDSTKREVFVEVSGESVKNKFEDVLGRITKEAKVAGFRPGHAPRDIIEKNYASHAHEQVLRELVPEVYNEAVKKEALDVIELPEISDVKLDRAKLSFKALVEVSPEIALRNYKGVRVEYKKASVSADEIKRSIDSLKESRKIDVIDDSFARSLGYPFVAELEKSLERQIFLQKENQERQRIEHEIIQAITKDLSFKIPESLVKRQKEDLLRHAKVDPAMKGMPKDQINTQEGELLKSVEPEAETQVRVYLVLAEIAKKENIPLDDAMPRRVLELLLREADWKESV